MAKKEARRRLLKILWVISIVVGIPRRKRVPLKPRIFVSGLNYEEVSFCSRECNKRVLLRGWYFPSKNIQRCIVITQGFGDHLAEPGAGLFEITKGLVDSGYNVLIFDSRASGQSGGNRIYLGYYEVYDVLGAYDFLIKKKNIASQNIGLLGFSYGAMTNIFAARKENFRALVIDSAPGDTAEFIKIRMKKFGIPLLFFGAAKYLTNLFFGIKYEELNAKEIIKEISAPAFFIYGKKDKFLFATVQDLYQLKKKHPLDRIWATDATHSKSYEVFPEEYLKNVIEFFNAAFKSI